MPSCATGCHISSHRRTGMLKSPPLRLDKTIGTPPSLRGGRHQQRRVVPGFNPMRDEKMGQDGRAQREPHQQEYARTGLPAELHGGDREKHQWRHQRQEGNHQKPPHTPLPPKPEIGKHPGRLDEKRYPNRNDRKVAGIHDADFRGAIDQKRAKSDRERPEAIKKKGSALAVRSAVQGFISLPPISPAGRCRMPTQARWATPHPYRGMPRYGCGPHPPWGRRAFGWSPWPPPRRQTPQRRRVQRQYRCRQ